MLVQSENNEEWFICKGKETEMYFNNEEINLKFMVSCNEKWLYVKK